MSAARVVRAVVGMLGIIAAAVVSAFAMGNPNLERPWLMLPLVFILALNIVMNYGALIDDWPF